VRRSFPLERGTRGVGVLCYHTKPQKVKKPDVSSMGGITVCEDPAFFTGDEEEREEEKGQ